MSLTSQEVLALECIVAHNTCVECGGVLVVKLRYSPERGNVGDARCAADPTHRGYARNPPPNRPLNYEEVKARGMLSSRRET
jgi:hypothetical protein